VTPSALAGVGPRKTVALINPPVSAATPPRVTNFANLIMPPSVTPLLLILRDPLSDVIADKRGAFACSPASTDIGDEPRRSEGV
jgi:hypothetical protein